MAVEGDMTGGERTMASVFGLGLQDGEDGGEGRVEKKICINNNINKDLK